MPAHSERNEGRKHGQTSMLTSGRVADGKAGAIRVAFLFELTNRVVGEKEEAVAGGI